MRRKLPASLIALLVCASLWPFDSAAAQRRRRRPARGDAAAVRAPEANRLSDARVARLGEEYMRGHYAFNP